MSQFSERLIKLRAESKKTLRVICQGAGIPPSRLVELERGTRIPTAGQIEHLENYYNVESGELAKLAKALENFD